VNGGNWTLTAPDTYHENIIAQMQNNASLYEKLDNDTCIEQYGIDYLSNRRNVIVVVSDPGSNNSLLGFLDWTYSQPENSWVCGTFPANSDNMTLILQPISDFDCSIPVALANDSWLMANQPVEYCLSETVPDVCRLQFAVPILVVVLCCNFVKLVCMILTIWRCGEFTMVTLGDALGNFLGKPDSTTVGMCTVSKKEIEAGAWPGINDQRQPRRWVDRRHFHCEAVGIRRWMISNSM
jgi:hypothetical protein